MDRVILHSDMNSCYASIEILHHPQLRNRPVAVGGDPESRHGIVLAKTLWPRRRASRPAWPSGRHGSAARRLCLYRLITISTSGFPV